jgi:hypothetical protein
MENADFVRLIEKTQTCWLWKGTIDDKGYGRLTLNKKRIFAHRYAYELLVAPITDGLELDHLCRNTRCVNPAHLEPVTHRENVLRGISVAAVNARKTICKRGHPLDGDNLYQKSLPRRDCRKCALARARKFNTRNPDKVAEYKRRWKRKQKTARPLLAG